MSTWVQQLKFGDRMDRARLMAECLLKPLSEYEQSIPIIPVPLHPTRLKSRGYNQAYEVARIIGQKQNRPIIDKLLFRIKDTAMQAELPEKQRSANVRSAFAVAEAQKIPHVIVLDDVMTTGQTLRSITMCLRKSGVERVTVAVFARSGD
ncbi:MAG: ComF family protein [Marinicella sp.]